MKISMDHNSWLAAVTSNERKGMSRNESNNYIYHVQTYDYHFSSTSCLQSTSINYATDKL